MTRRMMGYWLVATALCTGPSATHARDLDWAGIRWQVRSGSGHPCGSNTWSNENAWVDQRGALHLRLARDVNGRYACVQIASYQRFGYGRYTFEVTGPIGTIDPNVVLGMFLYPTPDVGQDGSNEIDVEIARWGEEDAAQLHDTVWNREGSGHRHTAITLSEDTTDAVFSFDWQPEHVRWSTSAPGGHDVHVAGNIAEKPQRLMINLWLYRADAPQHGDFVEFTINAKELP